MQGFDTCWGPGPKSGRPYGSLEQELGHDNGCVRWTVNALPGMGKIGTARTELFAEAMSGFGHPEYGLDHTPGTGLRPRMGEVAEGESLDHPVEREPARSPVVDELGYQDVGIG